jgi:uncharacterized surface protein with fasciclin (FAS1) repeats
MNIKISAVISSILLSGVVADDACKTINEVICSDPDLQNFCGLITATGNEDVFDQEEGLTVFVPNNSAVTSFDFLSALEAEDLNEIVLYHVHEGKKPVTTDKLPCEAGSNMLAMKSGKDSRTVCVDYEPTFQKGGGNAKARRPQITAKNIEACNGVVHLLDMVMLPNGFQEYEEAVALSSDNSSSASRRMQESGLFALAAGLLFMYL